MESWKGYGTAADKILCVYIFNEKSFVHALDFEDAYLRKGGFGQSKEALRSSTLVLSNVPLYQKAYLWYME